MSGSTVATGRRRWTSVAVVLGLCLGLGAYLAVPEPAAGSTPVIRTGKAQKVIGLNGHIDSVFATVRDARGMHAYLSNEETVWYDQKPNGTLTNGRIVMRTGPKGSPDQCGVHPIGGIYKVTAKHWVTFYHGERANPHQYNGMCYGGPGQRNTTRWSVLRMETFDGGLTWHKGKQVLRQDQHFMRWSSDRALARRDDAGSPRLVMRGHYLYLFYRAVNRDSPSAMQMSIARAPKSSLGAPGAWKKLYNGRFSEPGLGGRQTAISGLPSQARGITWNTYLKSYISVRVTEAGIVLYKSEGGSLTRWHELKRIVGRYTTESAWGKKCIRGETPDFPVALGYGATISWAGSSTSTGQHFWVYYMQKPRGKCFSDRYLMRRQVSLNAPLKAYPTPTLTRGAVQYRTHLSAPRRVKHYHGWIVSTRLTRNVYVPWPNRPVKVQIYKKHRWRTVKYLKTNRNGYVRLYGYGPYTHRFQVAKAGKWPKATSRTFYRKRH